MFAGFLNMRSLLLTCLLLLPAFARAERLPLKAYTVADGLPNNVINKIVRDSRGFLWFCTGEGLSRFDGYSFINYGDDQGLPHTMVNDFLETRNGELWIGTNGGLVLFNPKGEPTAHIVFANDKAKSAPMFTVVIPDDEDRTARAAIVLLEDRNGTIWCGTMKHLYRLERNENGFKLVPVDLGAKEIFVLDLLEDRSGSLWIGSFGGLFRRRPDGRIDHYTRRDGLPDEVIHDLLEDHQGQLWAATRNGGFFRFVADDTTAKPFVAETYNRKNGLSTDWVFQLFETTEHRFWLATNAGLVEYFPDSKKKGQLFRTYTRRSGLSFHEITALNEDMSGNLWLGTNVSGAMKLERQGFFTYDEQDGFATVNAIFGDHAGGVCFRAFVVDESARKHKADLPNQTNYRQQLGRYDDKGFRWFMPEGLANTGWVFENVTLQARNGEWWIGTGAGLYRFPAAENFTQIKHARPLAVYTTADGLATMQVLRLFEDSTGAIWVSTIGAPNGLARWQRTNARPEDLANAPGLPSPKNDLALAFGEDRSGNIWIGFSSGLARYRQGSFTFFTTNEGLPPGGIQSVYPDHAGRLWLGSLRGGLVRIDDPTAERPAFTTYTTAQGLSGNGTGVITEDMRGRIYVGTGRGLDQLDPDTGHIKHFTTADGLAGGAMSAAFRDRSGALWFGTQKGMSRFEPSSDTSSVPPPILINSLRVVGSSQHVSALGQADVSLPDFSAGQNQMQIDFVGLSFAVGDVLRYQYKLEGSGADWSAPTEQRTVNFASLSPGRYRFLVRAVNSDGVASLQPAVVTFTILPPIWQRWWFLTLVALSLAALGYAAYRYRLRRLIELERVRTRIASDLHDDIGSNLSLIAGLSEVLGQSARSANPQMAERLSVMADVSRRSVEAMSDIVWAVNPKRDNVVDLAHRMRRFASDRFAARNIEFHFDAPNPNQNVKLGAEVRREVFLVFKEAVNNIARHSGCKSAEAMLKVERGMIILKLSDDGRGFDEARVAHGQGLDSMRRRAEKLGGRLEVISANAGTTVILKAPVGRHG
jgi:ligand-binding sensor domain-containing protein/signal transduction histidine kinase